LPRRARRSQAIARNEIPTVDLSNFREGDLGAASERAIWAKQLPAVIEAIECKSPIQQKERDWIADRLFYAAHVYKLRVRFEARTPGEERKSYEGIASSTKRLLKRLGIRDPTLHTSGWPTRTIKVETSDDKTFSVTMADPLPWPAGFLIAEMQDLANKRAKGSLTMDPVARYQTLLQMLVDLHAASQKLANPGTPPNKRGGKRRQGPGAIGTAMYAIFDIYAEIRKRCPASGPKPGYSPKGPLVRFVIACFGVIDPRLSQAKIKRSVQGHFERW
jgi:hypothetical protein